MLRAVSEVDLLVDVAVLLTVVVVAVVMGTVVLPLVAVATGAVVGTWVTLVDVLVCVTTNLTRGLEAVVVCWGTGDVAVMVGVGRVVVVVMVVVA